MTAPVATSRRCGQTATVNDDVPSARTRYEQALVEVEEIKRELRERAQRVAAREKELEQMRLDVASRPSRERRGGGSADVARAVAEAEKREREAAQELALAKAERERLDERERTIKKVERELAGLRTKLEERRARLASEPSPAEPEPAGEPPPPTPLPQPDPEPDLEPAASATRRRARSRKR